MNEEVCHSGTMALPDRLRMTHPINMGVHTCFIIVRDQPQPLTSEEEILPDDFVAAVQATLCAAPDSRR